MHVDETYAGATTPSDEAPLFWGHQIHDLLVSKIQVDAVYDRNDGIPDLERKVAASATTKAVPPSNEPRNHNMITGNESYPGISLLSTAKNRHKGPVTPQLLQRQWGIGIETARRTIENTTQLAIRSAVHPLRRRYRTDLLSLHYRRFDDTVYTDTLFSKYVSRLGNTCAQAFCTKGGYCAVYPMKSKSEAGNALQKFVQDVGVPNRLHCDNAPEMVGENTEFAKTANFWKIDCTSTEANTPKQNHMEPIIGALRRRFLHMRDSKGAPNRMWDFGLKWNAETWSRTYRESTERTGIEQLTGDTPDISEYTDFSFYDRVWYWDSPSSQEPAQVGRWLGVSHRVGSSMCYYVLTDKAEILSRTTVQPISDLEMGTEVNIERFRLLDDGIRERLNDENFMVQQDNTAHMLYLEDVNDSTADPINPDYTFLPDVDDLQGDSEDGYDEYVGATMNFDLGAVDELRGVVVKRAKGEDGAVIGTRNLNPMLDTRKYQVRFTDGSHQELTANLIAENLYSQVNEHGHQQLLFKEIDGIRFVGDAALPERLKKGSNVHLPKTTAGLEIRVVWKDGTHAWLPMVEVKDSNPIELAEYAVLTGYDKEDTFAWRVPHALRTRRRMISKVKSKYWRTTHKFGMRVPKSVEEAYRWWCVHR